MKPLIRTLIAATAVLGAPAWACDGLKASDAWIREAPPGASVMAGYLTLANAGAEPRQVKALRSAAFGDIELHHMYTENGQMKMRMLDTLAVPAHGETKLAPGGVHLMLFHPQHALKAGDHVVIDLSCDRGPALPVDFTVKAQP